MFERMTDRGRRVIVLAQEEARMLNHNYIGTEHILLGLIHEGEGIAAQGLESLGISLVDVRAKVEEIIGEGQSAPGGNIPFTPRAKKVLELSLREGLQLGHNYIGTEHILLGLIREGEGVGSQVLVKLGAELTRVRQQIIQLLSGYQGKEAAEMVTPARVSFSPRTDQAQAWVPSAQEKENVLTSWLSENPAPTPGHWIDLTSIGGTRVAINLATAVGIVEGDGYTVVHLGGSAVQVKETIAEIWGE